MTTRVSVTRTFCSLALLLLWAGVAMAEQPADQPKPDKSPSAGQQTPGQATAEGTPGTPESTGGAAAASQVTTPSGQKLPAFGELLKDAETIEGLIRLYRKGNKLYGELNAGLLDRDFIVLISIARGIGEGPLLGGMSWTAGDDWIWQFRKVDDNIQIVRRNVRFTAANGSPEQKALRVAYTDSVLFNLPVATLSPQGGFVVDLTPVFMSDLPQISQVLKGFSFSSDKSTWASVKAFPDNVELEVAATYASGGTVQFDTVPDSRGATINVHYSISRLPETGYQPRLADDRVGYFITALKDFSKRVKEDRFIRYVNRWDLRKADPTIDPSPPAKPIIFWLEKTIPYEYRKPIREGILEWNKAFEKAGLANAIEVRQQPDDADWDPEDIHYNTFRWITSGVGLALGPSRVNPTNGEILDADVLFDADFLLFWRKQQEIMTPQRAGADRLFPPAGPAGPLGALLPDAPRPDCCVCELERGMARQLAFASVVLSVADPAAAEARVKELVAQALKQTAMHEVGHTLGLRHNFKGSAWLSLEDINNPEKTRETGMSASIMDYLPLNLVPKEEKQGDFCSGTIGPYDYWAIEYGYRPLSGGTEGEVAELRKIASRCAEPALQYAPDEQSRNIDSDPLAVPFDLGNDPNRFAQRQIKLIDELWPDVADRMTQEGEGYQDARKAFDVLLYQRSNAVYFAAKEIGGVYVYRDHKGDPDARPTLVAVDPQRQRAALALVEQAVFSPGAYQFPPELYNRLAPNFWTHWGMPTEDRLDYPLHEAMLGWQDRALSQLLGRVTLQRLIDSESREPAGKDVLTASELLGRLTQAVFQETDKLQEGKFSARQPAISSLRRNLQRRYLVYLSSMALGNWQVPDDCQTIAMAELSSLEARLNQVLAGKAELDVYTRAHLKESVWQIRKVLDAQMPLRNP